MSARLALLRDRLRDERSGKILVVSHCLLNENVHYLGGAFHPGMVDEIVDQARRRGCGLYQLPCPLAALERRAFNRDVIAANVVSGEGLFVGALRRALRHRHLRVPFEEHDLLFEMHQHDPSDE